MNKKILLLASVIILLGIIILPTLLANVVDTNTNENETNNTSSLGLVVSPKEINLNLVASSDSKEIITVTRVVRITNYLENITAINITQTGLDNIVFIEKTSFKLYSGESKDINVVFTAPTQAGIFTGEILINNKAVLVSLNVGPNLLFSDSNSSEKKTPSNLFNILGTIVALVIIILIVSILVKKRKTNK